MIFDFVRGTKNGGNADCTQSCFIIIPGGSVFSEKKKINSVVTDFKTGVQEVSLQDASALHRLMLISDSKKNGNSYFQTLIQNQGIWDVRSYCSSCKDF